jgi:hypothetical protein
MAGVPCWPLAIIQFLLGYEAANPNIVIVEFIDGTVQEGNVRSALVNLRVGWKLLIELGCETLRQVLRFTELPYKILTSVVNRISIAIM